MKTLLTKEIKDFFRGRARLRINELLNFNISKFLFNADKKFAEIILKDFAFLLNNRDTPTHDIQILRIIYINEVDKFLLELKNTKELIVDGYILLQTWEEDEVKKNLSEELELSECSQLNLTKNLTKEDFIKDIENFIEEENKYDSDVPIYLRDDVSKLYALQRDILNDEPFEDVYDKKLYKKNQREYKHFISEYIENRLKGK